MAKRSIIGITGQMGSGKSTAASYLKEKYGYTEYAFANPLKDIAVVMGFNVDQVYGTQDQKLEINKMWGVSGREFLQKFGTDICRDTLPSLFPNNDFGQNTIWIKLFEKYCVDNPGVNIVVSDVRFPDEARFITSAGGSIIRIDRTVGPTGSSTIAKRIKHTDELDKACDAPELKIHRKPMTGILAHKSETPIPECYVSYVIKNNYSIKNLHDDIDEALKELL